MSIFALSNEFRRLTQTHNRQSVFSDPILYSSMLLHFFCIVRSSCLQSFVKLTVQALLFLACVSSLFPQNVPPKREFRAVWIATVANIDFPLNMTDAPSKQRQDFIAILDAHKSAGMNAVIVQVRSVADAMYAKSREPWSQVLTGTQGQAPNPLWDPLEFMIAETHKRGMEFHAWFNPYRSVSSSSTQLAPNHIFNLHPEWHLTFANPYKLLNPGIPEVREYVASVIMDVVRNYDIDGVHFDDYFYPYGGTTNQDAATFIAYNRGIATIADWRRDNVNIFIKMIYDSLSSVKPHVKFGISPFGIWRSGVPSGIVGLDAYSAIYCDALAWLQTPSVDYIMPQLYWAFGGGQDYAKLMPWWLSNTNGRHLYTGNGSYRLSSTGSGNTYTADEIPNQVRFNRLQGAQGQCFYNSNSVTNNFKGVQDSLRVLYSTPALPPTMPWKDATAPLSPQNLRIAAAMRGNVLSWQPPAPARDGDTAKYYVVYRFAKGAMTMLDDPRTIIGLPATTEIADTTAQKGSQYSYIVTSVDKLHNESAPTATITTDINSRLPIFTDLAVSPNPIQTSAVVQFWLQTPERVVLTVFNLLGREVLRLADESLDAGWHQYTLSAEALTNGAYFCRLQAGNRTNIRPILVQR